MDEEKDLPVVFMPFTWVLNKVVWFIVDVIVWWNERKNNGRNDLD